MEVKRLDGHEREEKKSCVVFLVNVDVFMMMMPCKKERGK